MPDSVEDWLERLADVTKGSYPDLLSLSVVVDFYNGYLKARAHFDNQGFFPHTDDEVKAFLELNQPTPEKQTT